MHLYHFHMSFKLCPSRNQALPFANIHKQQFPLLNYCVIGNLPSLALVAQTNDVTGWESFSKTIQPHTATLLHWNLLDHPPYDELFGRYE